MSIYCVLDIELDMECVGSGVQMFEQMRMRSSLETVIESPSNKNIKVKLTFFNKRFIFKKGLLGGGGALVLFAWSLMSLFWTFCDICPRVFTPMVDPHAYSPLGVQCFRSIPFFHFCYNEEFILLPNVQPYRYDFRNSVQKSFSG